MSDAVKARREGRDRYLLGVPWCLLRRIREAAWVAQSLDGW